MQAIDVIVSREIVNGSRKGQSTVRAPQDARTYSRSVGALTPRHDWTGVQHDTYKIAVPVQRGRTGRGFCVQAPVQQGEGGLGRYSQGISVASALAMGLGGKIKTAFETTIRLVPQHADAHIALGTFHAEVIDKVGALIGNMTYGVKKDTCLQLFQQGLALKPKSPIAMMEYANALVILEGDSRHEEATALYERAAATKPMDAMERLDVDMARAELAM